jgi:hypothetical protein
MHVFDTAELRLLRAVERHVSVRRRIWQSVRALGALSLPRWVPSTCSSTSRSTP